MPMSARRTELAPGATAPVVRRRLDIAFLVVASAAWLLLVLYFVAVPLLWVFTTTTTRSAWHANGRVREIVTEGFVWSFETRCVWDERGEIDADRSGTYRLGLRTSALEPPERVGFEAQSVGLTLNATTGAIYLFRARHGRWPETAELINSAEFRSEVPGAEALPCDAWAHAVRIERVAGGEKVLVSLQSRVTAREGENQLRDFVMEVSTDGVRSRE